METINLLLTITGALSTIVGSILIIKSQTYKITLENYKDLTMSYEKKEQDRDERMDLLNKKLTKLAAELEIVKEIPLREISANLARVTSLQNKIIENQLDTIEHLGVIPKKHDKQL